jgi:type II secretory pathway component PulM
MLGASPKWFDQVLGVAGVLGAIAILLSTLALGWYVVWCTSLRHLPIAQEFMGNRRQSAAQKEQIAREIRDIKRVHSKRGPKATHGR